MSFVAEVLSSAGQMEREEINEKLSMLGKRMEELKMEIHSCTADSTTSTFTSFESTFDAAAALAEKVKAMSNEMQELSEKIETDIKGQLNISTGEFQSYTRQLEQVTMAMDILEKLAKVQQLMDNITTATSQKKYSEASSCLAMLETAFKQPVCEREDEIKILGAVRIQAGVLKQKLIHDLNEAWKETVSWTCLSPPPVTRTEKQGDSGDAEEVKQLELTMPKGDSESEQETLREMVTALEALRQLDDKIRTLGRQLAQNIFSDLVFHWQKVVIKEAPLSQGKKVLIKATSDRKQPHCVDVFSIVGSILDLLHESFLHVQVERKQGSGEGSSKVTLMTLLGDEIGEKVLEGLVKECLSRAIPSTAKELESFHEVVTVTQAFHDRLVALGFASDSSRTLLDYVQNVNVLFANKKCQDILERARGLMTTDIHDTVLISSDASPGELPPLDKSGNPSKEKQRKMDAASQPQLSSAIFRMPTCRISACVQEILDLVYSTLNEATTSSPQCAVQMFYAVHNIFELFCSVFPTYHAHSLANFPQLTALHHNNCMHLAHCLLTLGHQFKRSLPSDISATFIDLIPEIRSLGTSSFLEQMNTQKGILEQYLNGAKGFMAVDEDTNYASAERSLKQALHQLTHLQKVWQDVLPSSVYNKAIGFLLNSLIVHVVDSITSLEDISSEAARKLFTLLKLVDDKGTLLFLTDKDAADSKNASSKAKVDLHRYVPKYAKFTELQLVLNGSLQEIADRWADGLGPLGAEFPPKELKQLIRALFQNTDRRAAVLAKIK